MLWPKNDSYKEFDNEKNSCGSKIPIPFPPHNFSKGPSLITTKIVFLSVFTIIETICPRIWTKPHRPVPVDATSGWRTSLKTLFAYY